MSSEELARLDAMTDAEIEAAARSDPDAQPLTDEERRRFERMPHPKVIREQLQMTQKRFAETFGLSLSVVRDWEQGRFQPDQAARTLLQVIAYDPEAVKRALVYSQEIPLVRWETAPVTYRLGRGPSVSREAFITTLKRLGVRHKTIETALETLDRGGVVSIQRQEVSGPHEKPAHIAPNGLEGNGHSPCVP
jgi:putative transcriptional regulator